ncbi:chemotaxis protein CheW [Pseudomonas sp. dw_358]|uniref:chemotaxis protein CheW n=1 Tax=Pseudomonas sp. dw_358 TaxID=2720083 RepID=UPI001BD6AF43|nr:chemotaxis protein CheW [Pseudomonas sp. dw_358]
MSEHSLQTLDVIQQDAEPIDDCWNRIGVLGDKSCPLLVEHIHCRNCSVYAAAATRLLDRYSLGQQRVQQEYRAQQGEVASRSLLIFRLGDEWLALATRRLIEVSTLQPVHSLPHQRSRALLGVANVRGALVACLSLGELLGIQAGSAPPASTARVTPRMLIIGAQGGSVVVPVDEVDGIHGIGEDLLDSASVAASQAGARFTRCVLAFNGRSVRVLDDEPLLAAMTRSLT